MKNNNIWESNTGNLRKKTVRRICEVRKIGDQCARRSKKKLLKDESIVKAQEMNLMSDTRRLSEKISMKQVLEDGITGRIRGQLEPGGSKWWFEMQENESRELEDIWEQDNLDEKTNILLGTKNLHCM